MTCPDCGSTVTHLTDTGPHTAHKIACPGIKKDEARYGVAFTYIDASAEEQ